MLWAAVGDSIVVSKARSVWIGHSPALQSRSTVPADRSAGLENKLWPGAHCAVLTTHTVLLRGRQHSSPCCPVPCRLPCWTSTTKVLFSRSMSTKPFCFCVQQAALLDVDFDMHTSRWSQKQCSPGARAPTPSVSGSSRLPCSPLGTAVHTSRWPHESCLQKRGHPPVLFLCEADLLGFTAGRA